ncbi:MAG: hypothetical protein RMJ17_00155 [Candidatus Aenigmarchaeota archaeon]|nr:hypothetical protein [Candidatus Aenigmarchaeota archaeon]MDW8149004.1 hypothetical protein [Candidatus Aenigmarchaeota archaeon]
MVKYTLSKGQVFSYDFFIAATAFTFIIALLTYYFFYYFRNISEERKISEAFSMLNSISNIFFEEGIPSNWNETNLIKIGLSTNNQVDNEKLQKLKKIPYDKFLNSIGSGFYYVKIEILDKNKNLIYEYPTLNLTGKFILRYERKIILNNSYAFGIVYLLEK